MYDGGRIAGIDEVLGSIATRSPRTTMVSSTEPTVILTGISGNICVLFSANDAYMRDFHLLVPADCVVSNTEEENRHALEQMQKVLKADVTPSESLDLDEILRWSASATRDPARSPSRSSTRPLRRP